mmetsp:Transcript_21895/g.49824  ORF Transcript_21895/g.49824 Transcript_21895/m.49824 type:complete len:245 (-) Transcript_21895:314-1048(-)
MLDLRVSNREFEGVAVPAAMEALAQADAVCFDVDSTVVTEEGIDVLAAHLGVGQQVADLTASAMSGTTKFEDALAARLSLMQPSKKSILKCIEELPLEFSPGLEDLVDTLRNRGTDVFLVSGGFRIMIEPLAIHLGIPIDRVYANTINFGKTGEYVGFDSNEPTSADGGKPRALRMIKEKGGYDKMVMVGDGATDAQARPPADAFLGYGGVIVRESVRSQSDWFVYDFKDMIYVVKNFGKGKNP